MEIVKGVHVNVVKEHGLDKLVSTVSIRNACSDTIRHRKERGRVPCDISSVRDFNGANLGSYYGNYEEDYHGEEYVEHGPLIIPLPRNVLLFQHTLKLPESN